MLKLHLHLIIIISMTDVMQKKLINYLRTQQRNSHSHLPTDNKRKDIHSHQMIMQIDQQRHQQISQRNVNINNKYPIDIKFFDMYCYNNEKNLESIITSPSVKDTVGVIKAASRNPKIKVCFWLMQ